MNAEHTISELKKRAWQAIGDRESELCSIALCILNNPELGYKEKKAARWLSEPLQAAGFKVEQPLAGLPTAFRAIKSCNTGPIIAFLAEYDALPEIGHGCGHNLIGPAAIGAALGVASVLPELTGEIWVVGTPAEEYLGQVEGKVRLLKAGVFDKVNAALMMHPHYANCIQESDMGFIAFNLVFHGRAAHAASRPWAGVNALDGLLLTYTNINALRQHVRPEIRIHGIITDGGQAPNTIPERAAASMMVRARDPESMEEVYTRVIECARAGAMASGAQLDVERITTVHNTRVNQPLNQLLLSNSQILELATDMEPFHNGGSSDFGNVSQVVPSATFWTLTHPDLPWHTEAIARGSGDEMALQGMIASARVMAGAAVDLLADPSLMDRVSKDFLA
ncbi:MAG: M20 family metallopeptidase [Anaerolineales bacterium]|nr:M20 family metallopeptidase [Anaerolineales bacterium]